MRRFRKNNRPEHIVPQPGLQGADPGTVQNVDNLSVEEDLEDKTDKSYSQGQLVLRRFLRHRGAMVSLGALVFITLLAYTSIGWGPFPGWWKHDYTLAGTVVDGGRPTLSLWPPAVGEHPFGQDNAGKDFFALVMRGTQRSLISAFVVALASTVLGTAMGAAAGYFRGWVEAVLMRLTDLLIVIPLLVIAAVPGQISAGSIWMLALMLGVVTWTGLARLVRGEVLSLREREFVDRKSTRLNSSHVAISYAVF